jgi:hypothetical protein
MDSRLPDPVINMGKPYAKTEKELRGDKLRDLILLVYLNNKYGHGNEDVEKLREIVGYNSPGGIYSVLNSSGYFKKAVNGVELTDKGKKYLNKKILTPFTISNYVGAVLMLMGFVFLFQWFEWTYYQFLVIIPLEVALLTITGGFIIRFFMLKINYLLIKKSRHVDI